MRRLGHRGRVDGNHEQVVLALRRAGIAVKSLAAVGEGVPDLLCCFRDRLVLLEVKVPGEKLNAAQEKFAETFPVKVVTSPADAVLAVVEAAR